MVNAVPPVLPDGTKPMTIEGPNWDIRVRVGGEGMSELDRQWRKQWVKDQELSPREPVIERKLIAQRMNPIKRAMRFPADYLFFNVLEPKIGYKKAFVWRGLYTKLMWTFIGAQLTYYYLKYEKQDWTSTTGWRVFSQRPRLLPGDAGYPHVVRQQPNDYYDKGFKQSIFYKPVNYDK